MPYESSLLSSILCLLRPHLPLSSHINLVLQSDHILTFYHQKPILISRSFVNMPLPSHPTRFSFTQNIRGRITALQTPIFCSLQLLNVYLQPDIFLSAHFSIIFTVLNYDFFTTKTIIFTLAGA